MVGAGERRIVLRVSGLIIYMVENFQPDEEATQKPLLRTDGGTEGNI